MKQNIRHDNANKIEWGSVLLTVVLLLLSAPATGQSLQVDFDKKVLYCDSLNMPVNTSARELLYLLPEVLQRPMLDVYSAYDVKVEGMSMTEAKDVVLGHLHIDDIERIEVDESPLTSYLKNGVGGSINIVLRSHGSRSDALWGSANVSTCYPFDLAPQLLLGHRTEKFMLRGMLLGDVYNNRSDIELTAFDAQNELISSSHTDLDYKYRSQVARAYLQYTPTTKDVLRLNVSETYRYQNERHTPDYHHTLTTTDENDNSNLHALFNWQHTWTPRTLFVVEGQYVYNPGDNRYDYPGEQELTEHFTTRMLAGSASLRSALLPATAHTQLYLNLGCNINATYCSNAMDSYYHKYDTRYTVEPYHDTHFVQPFLNLELTAGKFRAKAIGEYQHFAYEISRLDKAYDMTSNDFTGKLITEYHLTPHRNLRLILDRKLNRPSENQLFPMLYFDPESSNYALGNPTLLPVLSHEVRLDEISDHQWGEHNLTLNISGSYNNIDRIIHSVSTSAVPVPGILGLSLDCNTYENNGTNHIFNANLMAHYNYRAFSMSLSGNLYHNQQHVGATDNHYTYYNMALYGQFRLQEGWQGSAKLTYYSQVTRANETLGDCATTTLSVGRYWNRIGLYVFDRIALQKSAVDHTTHAGGAYTLRAYELAPNIVGIGARYSF